MNPNPIISRVHPDDAYARNHSKLVVPGARVSDATQLEPRTQPDLVGFVGGWFSVEGNAERYYALGIKLVPAVACRGFSP